MNAETTIRLRNQAFPMRMNGVGRSFRACHHHRSREPTDGGPHGPCPNRRRQPGRLPHKTSPERSWGTRPACQADDPKFLILNFFTPTPPSKTCHFERSTRRVRSRETSAWFNEISPLTRSTPSVEMAGAGARFTRSVESHDWGAVALPPPQAAGTAAPQGLSGAFVGHASRVPGGNSKIRNPKSEIPNS